MKYPFMLKICVVSVLVSLLSACASIHDKAYNGDLEGIKSCIRSGENINQPFGKHDFDRHITDKDTPLSIAVKQNRTVVVLELLKAGADAKNWRDGFNNTLLHIAPEGLDGAITAALVRAGLDVNARNRWGELPLCEQAYRANPGPVMELVKYGASVNVSTKDGLTPLMYRAGDKNLDTYTQILQYLINARADVNASDKEGNTALHYAAMKGTSEGIEILLKAGARVNAANRDGNTPLHLAALEGTKQAALQLVTSGALVNARNQR